VVNAEFLFLTTEKSREKQRDSREGKLMIVNYSAK
jgi:hypothetical protein